MQILTRNNRRKTTKARRTQVINVPKFIPRKGLSKEEMSIAIRITQGICTNDMLAVSDLFVKNESKWAGKSKFIFHATPKR